MDCLFKLWDKTNRKLRTAGGNDLFFGKGDVAINHIIPSPFLLEFQKLRLLVCNAGSDNDNLQASRRGF